MLITWKLGQHAQNPDDTCLQRNDDRMFRQRITARSNYRCVVSGDGCPGEGLVFGDTTGTYWGITLVVEDCWFLTLAGENPPADDVNGKDFRVSEWWEDIAGLLETLSKRLPVERMASTGLLGSVASTMWIRSRPAVVVRRSNSWTRLFWMRARSLRRISHSLSNASLSSAICKPTVLSQWVCHLLQLHCYVWNSSNRSRQRSVNHGHSMHLYCTWARFSKNLTTNYEKLMKKSDLRKI